MQAPIGTLLLIIAIATASGWAAPSMAQIKLNPPPLEPRALAHKPQITPREAARIAQARNGGGKVLAVRLLREQKTYVVKLLKDGDVRSLRVPSG